MRAFKEEWRNGGMEKSLTGRRPESDEIEPAL
jgi:hypothetical protein